MCDTQIKKKKSLDYQVQLYDLTRQSTLSRTLTPRLKLGIARLRLRRDFSSSLDSQVTPLSLPLSLRYQSVHINCYPCLVVFLCIVYPCNLILKTWALVKSLLISSCIPMFYDFAIFAEFVLC